MKKNLVFVICVMAISGQNILAESASAGGGGYFYDNPNRPQIFDISAIRPSQESRPIPQQELHPPPQHQHPNTLGNNNNYFEKAQHSLPNAPNPSAFAIHHQHYNQQQPLNFEPQTRPQLNNINYQPSAVQNQFINLPAENVMRMQFEVLNEIQGNSQPIVGQFKPELVDLANGGPLTRMITTCGPNTDCKTIALQSDLNRVLAVLPRSNHNQITPHHHQQGNRGYTYNTQIEGRGYTGSSLNADVQNSLVRPPNRRLFQYTEIPRDDIYN